MAEPIVVNTGPLVSFARIGCLDVIGRLPYEFLCPVEVWQELDEGRASGHPWAAPAWLKEAPGQTVLTRLAGRPRPGRSRGHPTRP